MPTISQAFAISMQHYRAGRLALAEQVCREILQAEPEHADTLHLAGVVAHQLGRHEAGAELIRQAIRVCPTIASYHNNLGLALNGMGKLAEAVVCYRRALELSPDLLGAHINLGLALVHLGDLAEAEVCYRQALQLKSDCAEAWSNLGDALRQEGKLDEAADCCRRALRFQPRLAEAHHNLGRVLRSRGRFDEARQCYQAALRIRPDHPEILHHLGIVWKDLGHPDEAARCYRRVLEIQPGHVEAWGNLGNVLRALGNLPEACQCYERTLELQPAQPGVYNNLGNMLNDVGRFDEAIAAYHEALRLKPDYAEAYSNLASVLHRLPDLDGALSCYRRAIELNPRLSIVTSNYLCVLRYDPATTAAEYGAALADFERRHTAPLRAVWQEPTNSPDPDRPLRLGFASPRLAQGPVGAFLIRALENLDRRQFSLGFYSDGPAADAVADRFRAVAAFWRDVAPWNDDRLAQQIRTDQVDILFDLAGHAPHNRLLTFARRPAPVQITWIDSVGSTGLSAMDYLVGDPYEIPPELESSYAERVLRMPETYVCFDPPGDAPPVGPLPAASNGYVTFASFNNPAKITPEAVELWARILQRVAGSHLVLKYQGFDAMFNRRRYGELLSRLGVDEDRVEFQGGASHAQFLAAYHGVDVGLDPIYNGGLTTCEALWMGVPVITCPGVTFARRHSLSHLSNAGITETIAGDFDDYVERAVNLAGDLPRLAAMRAGLRAQMAASPLCDGPRFAANLMAVLRSVWREWCART